MLDARPICFHILAERGCLGEYVERGRPKRWSETVRRLIVMYTLSYRPVKARSVSVAGCGRRNQKADFLN